MMQTHRLHSTSASAEEAAEARRERGRKSCGEVA